MSGEEGRDWPRELRAGGPITDAALADLRSVLLRGLRRALSGRAGADDALIEDLAQEATLRVLGRLDGYRGESRFTTWAVTIAVRGALTELRRPRWRDVSLDRLAAEDRGAPPDPPTPAPGPPLPPRGRGTFSTFSPARGFSFRGAGTFSASNGNTVSNGCGPAVATIVGLALGMTGQLLP